MLEFWHGILIALIPGFIAFLLKLIISATGISLFPYPRNDFAIDVVEQYENEQKIKIKTAYAGSSPLIIKHIELKSSLSLSSTKERFRAWFQIARGYLTDDWEGLQTVFGRKFIQREIVWLSKSFNILTGILFSLLILTLIYNPFGWILLLIGPYNVIKIKSSNINTKDTNSNIKQILPFLFKSNEEKEFVIDFKFSVKSRLFTLTEAEIIQSIPNNLHWKLPRP